jgi:hypothetical protein
MIPDELLDLQRRNNRQSVGCWEQFDDHRSAVMSLLSAAAGERIALLGAGNCNDVDLPELALRFREIHLVDLDAEALHRARGKQLPETAASLVLRAPIDLSGALELMPGWRAQRAAPAQISSLPETCAARVAAALPEPFDVVVSTCLLSQIMHACGMALGAAHPDCKAVRSALAIAHVRSLVDVVRPGGTGILVSDTCSTRLYPPLEERWRQVRPRALLEELDERGSVLDGTRPSTLFAVLTSDPAMAPRVADARIVEPWLWRMGPIVLLTYAIVFRRRDRQ